MSHWLHGCSSLSSSSSSSTQSNCLLNMQLKSRNIDTPARATPSIALRPSHPPPQSTQPTSALQRQLRHSTRGSVGVLLHSPPSLPVLIASPRTQAHPSMSGRQLISLDLVRKSVVPLLFSAAKPHFHSLEDTQHLHTSFVSILTLLLDLATPAVMKDLDIDDPLEQHAVCEIVLNQVLKPSEQGISHPCQ
ncbi:hypothetical protein BLNAU_24662 [Blattamonas nauphoetae]|uniref:Uncharacterized protein n=1 Tax=Blattamonas nauphoetae TaxID=2049346 RepID=A0ABQ9WQW7_9EUKA|nr:hypothetical protein BLNAU_24662 [Blattamonas nauphoetae]